MRAARLLKTAKYKTLRVKKKGREDSRERKGEGSLRVKREIGTERKEEMGNG